MVIVRWYGHACFEIVSSKGTVVVIDPHDGRSLGLKPPRTSADIVLITHEHFDHNAYSIVAKPSASVFSMHIGKELINDVWFIGIEAYHDREKGKKRGRNIVYKLYVDGISFVHVGDLGHELDAEYSAKLGSIDILMIPVGGTFTIDAKGAWRTIENLKPRAAIPMHYWIEKLNLPLRPVEDFIQQKPSTWNVVKLDDNTLSIEADRIKQNTIYILTPP
ncbi:MAG: MBL fold metallo-hydrolase [Ignisphaera sp.]|nr:MBL fold metallo-hydrolase [Ignisphaera sp.]MCX8168184.1 MBL fold metallo-hydrolase [Ignisphaera sp.]MDW8084945.1 MBL fold metallo-hydrolase [Ignisphaera sp.]